MDIVDFHAHVLPGADHGSHSVENSLCQLKMAKECGVSRIVATPHFYPSRDTVASFKQRQVACFEKIAPLAQKMGIELVMGAETLICENIENLPGLAQICLGNSSVILLELPFNDFSREYVYSVKALLRSGFQVVLAHADRYPPDDIEVLIDCGAKIQLNADSLATLFKNRSLYRWIDMGVVVALGSDIHGNDKRAYQKFITAQKRLKKRIDLIAEASNALWADMV